MSRPSAPVPLEFRDTVEHQTGDMSCVLTLDDDGQVATAALLRTARKLMDGEVFA